VHAVVVDVLLIFVVGLGSAAEDPVFGHSLLCMFVSLVSGRVRKFDLL
jgi:hypothetical protein